jgi:SAM-dependent methyltransferase
VTERRKACLVESYDRVADDYAREFSTELERKPFDRALMEKFVATLPPRARVCDLGCGPGHITAHLRTLGADSFGIDLSPVMVAVAGRLNPSIPFRVGDMQDLDLATGSVDGITAFYSIIHLSREALPRAFQEMARVLRPGGRALVSFHCGPDDVHLDEWFGREVSLDFYLFDPEEVLGALRSSRLSVDQVERRAPYDFEPQTERTYVLATRRADDD